MFDALYLQTAHVQRPGSSLDRYGRPTFAAPVAFACRYQPSNLLVRNADGEQVVASCVLYTAEPITIRDLVFPPGADPGNSNQGRHPMKVDAFYDLLTGAISYYSVTL